MKKLLKILIISAFSLSAALSQDQAERLYENANTFMNAGKYKEALTDLENVINNYGDTEWASMALLKIGTYYLETQQDFSTALGYFSRIQEDYPRSKPAPAAFYFKARIMEQQGETIPELEKAVADLIRMDNLFPDNEWRNGAMFLFGKLSARLMDYDESLNYFQTLEFTYPKSEFLPKALLLSAKAAYFKNQRDMAAMILARLQSKFPNTEEAVTAASYLRLLDRFGRSDARLELDQTFVGGTPKRYSNPGAVLVTANGTVAVRDQKMAYFSTLGPTPNTTNISSRDLVEFCTDRGGGIMLVYENRIMAKQDGTSFTSLNYSNGNLREIRSASMDDFGRLYVVDGDVRDLLVFSPDGTFIKSFSQNKPRLVRCFGNEAWVLTNDNTVIRFDGAFNSQPHGFSGLSSVTDFQFDPFGNLYVLSDRSSQISIYAHNGEKLLSFNLKSGGYPLKQAQAIAVDTSGAVYLSDRRGGAVYRFQ